MHNNAFTINHSIQYVIIHMYNELFRNNISDLKLLENNEWKHKCIVSLKMPTSLSVLQHNSVIEP